MGCSACLWLLLSLGCVWGMGRRARETVLGTLGKATMLRIPPELQNLTLHCGEAMWKRDTEDPQRKLVLLKYSGGNYTNFMQGRNRFHKLDFSLEILNTSRQDRQLYEYVVSKASEEEVWQIQLEVYEPVSHPSIQILSRVLANGSCAVTLNCTTERGDNVSYNWASQDLSTSGLCSHNGSLLHLSYSLQDASIACACTASNPISSRVVTFNSSECNYEHGGRCRAKDGATRAAGGGAHRHGGGDHRGLRGGPFGHAQGQPGAGALVAGRGRHLAHHLLPSAAGGEAEAPPGCRAPLLHHHLRRSHRLAPGHSPGRRQSPPAPAQPPDTATRPAGPPTPLTEPREGPHDGLRQGDDAHGLSFSGQRAAAQPTLCSPGH